MAWLARADANLGDNKWQLETPQLVRMIGLKKERIEPESSRCLKVLGVGFYPDQEGS